MGAVASGSGEGAVIAGHVGWASFGLAVLLAQSSFAADSAATFLDEVRIGGTHSGSVQLEALLPASPPLPTYNRNLSWLLTPRPLVGVSISATGKTNQAYAGVAWTVPILGPLFAEASVGGMIHDQALDKTYTDRSGPLTSRLLFRESIAVGYAIDPTWRVLVFANHSSNGNLGYRNLGINQFGVLVGAKLGETERPAMEPAPLPRLDWAGPYVGFGIGLAFGEFNFTTPTPTATAPTKESLNIGGQVGYNWAFGSMLMGLEGDYTVQNLEGSAMVVSAGEELSASSRWLATARGRVGAELDIPFVSPQSWIYGTGGVAFSRFSKNFCPMGPPPQCYSGGDVSGGWSSIGEVRAGWTAGAGIEAPLARGITLKGEYLYANFGKLNYTNGVTINQFTYDQQIIRVGVNFH